MVEYAGGWGAIRPGFRLVVERFQVTGFELDQGNSSRLLTLSFTGVDLTQARTSTTVAPWQVIPFTLTSSPFESCRGRPRS